MRRPRDAGLDIAIAMLVALGAALVYIAIQIALVGWGPWE